MKLRLGCQLNYQIAQFSTFVFNIRAGDSDHQKICQETLKIEPQQDFDELLSPVSDNRYFRLNAPAGKLQVSYQATVEVSQFYANPGEILEVPPAELPLEVVPFLFPSRYCQSDKLMQLAQSEFGDLLPGYSRVTAICNWIYDKVAYLSGSTDSQTSAYDTATERAGVCRDFAHLGIAFCRALNIPARFVGGYAYGLNPPDFHAYFEAYLGDRWYLFDATRLVPLNGTVRIGTGRDAADVSFATIFGPVQMDQMQLFIEPVLNENASPQDVLAPTTEAISTS
ncbi:MAG: transglutaminase family protein [Microcoleus vaginatus WJT46-NPBG5]|jgi:transglutaminase-like putative cysteine protease|nr:transglutaminase family protein [Microcoleus vaginatus WJT46-NPBG5]